MNINNLMKQAQQLQEKLKQVQEESKKLKVTGQSGGGLVKITIDGNYYALPDESTIDPEVYKEEPEICKALILAGFNDAITRHKQATKDKTKNLTAEMQLPPGFNLPLGD